MKRYYICQINPFVHTMKITFMQKEPSPSQSGIVSIITVLMFSVLIGIVLAGFTKLALQEQSETLQDSLSKSAYNSAQAGVEDAKRAIAECMKPLSSRNADVKCDATGLYNPQCPGFNATGSFEKIGIDKDNGEGTQVGAEGAKQRYSCVIVKQASDIETNLGGPNSTKSSAMYEITDPGSIAQLVFRWHSKNDGATDLPSAVSQASGNVREPDWQSPSGVKYPAVLRAHIFDADAQFQLVGAQKTAFLYPSSTAVLPSGSYIYGNCNKSSETYVCQAPIAHSAAPTATKRYLVLQAMYRGTNVRVSAVNSAGDPVAMNSSQLIIDSTGATDQVYRRVQVRVGTGNPSVTGTALDVGNSVCKDFYVGESIFDNKCQTTP